MDQQALQQLIQHQIEQVEHLANQVEQLGSQLHEHEMEQPAQATAPLASSVEAAVRPAAQQPRIYVGADGIRDHNPT